MEKIFDQFVCEDQSRNVWIRFVKTGAKPSPRDSVVRHMPRLWARPLAGGMEAANQ